MKRQLYKLKYNAPKGMRTHKGFNSVTLGGAPSLWWNKETKKWQDDCIPPCSNHAPCKTLKAFKRMIRKNPIIMNGVPYLCQPYYVQDKNGKFLHDFDIEVIK